MNRIEQGAYRTCWHGEVYESAMGNDSEQRPSPSFARSYRAFSLVGACNIRLAAQSERRWNICGQSGSSDHAHPVVPSVFDTLLRWLTALISLTIVSRINLCTSADNELVLLLFFALLPLTVMLHQLYSCTTLASWKQTP